MEVIVSFAAFGFGIDLYRMEAARHLYCCPSDGQILHLPRRVCLNGPCLR